MPALAQDDEPNTPTPISTETEFPVTEEATPTPTETEEGTPTPGEDLTPSPSPTGEGSETSTPEPTPLEEEPPLPTETAQVEVPPYTLTLSSNPAFLTAGGVVTLRWTLEGELSAETPLRLEIQLPEGFEAKKKKDVEQFDSVTRIYSMPITTSEGSLLVETSQMNEDAVFSAQVWSGAEPLAFAAYLLPRHERFEVGKNGGRVNAMNGKVKVTFPSGAVRQDIVLHAGLPVMEHLPADFSHKVFELTAHVKGNEEVGVEQFDAPLTIEVDYSDLELTEDQEAELYLYWYNEETGDWHALESYRDSDTKTLRAYTDHFTVFDIGVNDWRAERLPTTEAYQVAKFTGAATFSLPIEVLPGPGGFQPNITLSYNSQVVDQATTKTQASWVGMGWSLDGGGGMITDNGSDGYMIAVNGISTQLVQQEEGGRYYTANENFWKITRVDNETDDYWKVYDTVGNVYIFDTKPKYAYYDTESGTYKRKTYAWYLTTATNTHGKTINYEYHFQYNNNVGGKRTDTAVYLDTITYGGGKMRVRFIRSGRGDYPSSYDTDEAVHMYQKWRLDNIIVEQKQESSGSFAKVRKYEFTYVDEGGSASDRIWPNINYSAGGDTLTLRSVQEQGGWNGTTWTVSLPPNTFTYDKLHLKKAENGYGGMVEFVYEAKPWYSETTPSSYVASVVPCLEGSLSPWVIRQGSSATCSQTGELSVTNSTVTTGSLGINKKVRPGGVYKVVFTGTRTSGSTVQVGLMYRVGMQYTQWRDTHGFSYIVNPFNVNASTLHAVFKATGTGKFTKAEVRLLQSFYRVETKKVSDGTGNQYVTIYDYDNPYINLANEFSGHGVVTEIAPDGTKTKTYYHQQESYNYQEGLDEWNWALAGRVKRVEVYAPNEGSNGVLRSKTENNYSQKLLPYYSQWGQWGSRTRYHAWVKLDSEINYIYNIDGNQIGGTRTDFTYEETYGNLITKKEYDNPEGTGAAYRTTTIAYAAAKTNNGVYIVSLPSRQTVKHGNTILSDVLYYYNGSTTNGVAVTKNILTMTRSLVANGQYARTEYDYDEWGNQISVTTYAEYENEAIANVGGAQTTTTEYDGYYHAFPVKVTNALGQVMLMEYDYKKGVPTCASPLLPPSTEYTACEGTTADYDAFGRIERLIRPGDDSNNPTIRIEYAPGVSFDPSDNKPFTTTITQRIDASQTFSIIRKYDGMGREIETNAGGVVTTTVYESPTVTKQSLPNSADVTKTEYFPSDNKSTVTAPDGTFITTVVDGLTTTVTDAKGNKTVTVKDVWGRVVSVTPRDAGNTPVGPNVTYQYDAANNLRIVTRGGATTTIDYDEGGRKISMDDPDMGVWTYSYDALGNLTRQTDARGQRICMYYDSLNRLTGKHYRMDDSCPSNPSSYDMSYTYDQGTYGIGHRTEAKNILDNIVSTWTYDERGRVKTETVMGQTTHYDYNSADLPIWMKYPDDEILSYSYNDRMLLTQLLSDNETPTDTADDILYASSMQYDAAGRLTSRLLGNGLAQNYTYYDWNEKVNNIGQGGRLKNLTTGTLQDLNYIYDSAGNITTIENYGNNASEVQDFAYDALYRLTHWTLNDALQEVYTYDEETGNLLTKGAPTEIGDLMVGALKYQYDPDHKHAVQQLVSSADEEELGNSYLYDANGSQTKRTIGNDVFDLTYNAENRLVKVEKNSDTTIAEFTYDADGRRVKSVMDGETILFIGGHYEIKNPGSLEEVTKYYFAGATRIAMRKYTIPVSMEVEYFLTDHLGSTSITTDADGDLVSEMRYKPWGEVRYAWAASQSTTPAYEMTKYSFTGQYSYMDDITTENVTEGFGLMYYNARMYDPALGRFTSADTIIPPMQGVQGWDRYAYVNNSPVMYTDPTGHEICLDGIYCGSGSVSSYQNYTPPASSPQAEEDQPVDEPTYGDGLIGPPVNPCTNGRTCLSPWTPSQSYSNPPSGISPATAIQIESYIIGFINDVNYASPLIWRKAFTTAKAFNPNPSIDAVLGAVGQGLEDLSNPNLSFEQRGMRMGIAALESGVTGVVSDVIGVGAAAIVPSPYVYAGAQVVSSFAIDYWVWPSVNQEYLGSDYGY